MCRTQNGADVNAIIDYNNNINSIIENGSVISNTISAAQKDGRGNICPVTIILPTLAMQCKNDFDEDVANGHSFNDNNILISHFMELLNKKLYEAKDMLLERFNYICSQAPTSAKFMYENNVMSGYIPNEGIRSAIRHGTIVLGMLGMAETLQILIGKNQTSQEGLELAKKILQLYSDRANEFKKEYSLNFGVYYTPAENLCYTAMKKFKAEYGEIKNISDHDYFTNSIHVPVWENISVFEKANIESELSHYGTAGQIFYCELPSGVKNNLKAVEQIVNYALDKDLPYIAINVPVDLCLDCGYEDEIGECCPQCNSKHIQRLRRVTGYLTGDYKTAFNLGKQQEVEQRVKHVH